MKLQKIQLEEMASTGAVVLRVVVDAACVAIGKRPHFVLTAERKCVYDQATDMGEILGDLLLKVSSMRSK